MIGKTVSHYKIISKLGEGGMGVVYKAEDTKLHRTVALKFLPTQLTHDPTTKKRFIREARNASAVQHNNVCTIHEIGETDDGQMYICMDYYEGKTLDRLLADGEITVESAIDMVIQIAEGLSKAHETGITHRDIKPANVMVTSDGVPKLLDFGLAKLGADTRVTKTGVTVGTVAYMSPEQVSGDEVDARSDIWSLGVVLYELLTGVLPFRGEQPAAIMYGIMNTDPPAIADYWSEAPARLQSLINRALRKDKENRFQSAGALMLELVEIEEQLVGTGKRRRSTARPGARTQKRTPLIGLVASIVILASLAAFIIARLGTQAPTQAMAIAVMDFSNLSDPEDNVRTAGMAGLLHVGFVQNVSARVVSPDYLRDVGRRLFGAESGPVAESQVLEVAKKSGANLMLTGQVGASGDNRYVVWRLVDTRTGEILGAGRVNGSDQLMMADDIVAEVAQVLHREFGIGGELETESVSEMTTKNAEAHEFFVAGMLAGKAFKREDAIENFQKAIALDSTFALAYLEMAFIQHGFLLFGDALASTENAWKLRDKLSVKDRMRLEAFRLQLNYKVVAATDVYRELAARWPDDYDILRGLVRQLYFWWSFQEALEVARQASVLYPDDEFFASLPGQILTVLGRADEALAAERAFVRKFPKRLDGLNRIGRCFLNMGLPDSAEVTFRHHLSEDPDNFFTKRLIAVLVPYCRGDLKGALANCERILDDDTLTASQRGSTHQWLRSLRFEAGQYGRVLKMFDEEPPKTRIDAFYDDRARVGYLLGMGKFHEALQWSEALAETLRVHAEEVDDPQYLQYMGIARWTAKEHRASALAQLDSLDAAEAAADEVFKLGQEFGAYAIRSALLVKLRIAIKRGNVEEASTLLDELETVGGHVGLWYNRLATLKADVYVLQGRHEDAEKVLREQVQVYVGHAFGYFKLGQLYEKMNRSGDAVENYQRFLQLWSEADEGLTELVEARSRVAALGEQE